MVARRQELARLDDQLAASRARLAELQARRDTLQERRDAFRIETEAAEAAAEEARRAKGEIVPAGVNGRRIMVTKHPIGVVGMITAWNSPRRW